MILGNNATVSAGTTEISTACINTSIGTLTITNSVAVGVDANASLTIQGTGVTLNINSGGSLLSTGAVTLGGTVFYDSGTWTNYAGSTVTYTGESDNAQVTISSVPTYSYLNVSKSGTVFVQPGPVTVTRNLNIMVGTLDLQGENMTVSGNLTNADNFRLKGTENVSAAPTGVAGSTITYNNGGGTNLVYSTWTYKNLFINGAGTFNPSSAVGLTVNENLTVAAGTLDTTASNYSITAGSSVYLNGGVLNLNASTVTVSRNWSSNGGAFNANNSTITFNGATIQQLSGSTTFYALRALTSGATLQFSAGTTNYVTNMVDFENNYLRSTSTNATWYFALSGSSQTLKALNVEDSNASLGNVMLADAGSTNGGNNTNWYFGVTQVAADRYWVLNSGTGNWSNTSNWSTSQFGSGGASVPTAGQVIAFTGANNGNCNIDVAVNVSTLIIQGYSGTINTQNNSVTIGNGYTQTSGTFTMGSSTASIGGSYTHSAGTFTSGTSTVTFNTTSAQTITSGGAVFSHTIFNGNNGYWNLADQFSSTGNFTVSGGTVDTTSSSYGIYVGSDVVLSGGALTLNASTMTAGSNWTLQPGGTFNAGTSTVTFQGGSAGSYSLLTSSKTQSFAHLKFNQPNATWLLQDGLNLGGNLTLAGGLDTNSSGNYSLGVTSDVVIINGGSLTMNASQVTIGGSFKFATGGLDVGSSTVTLIGSGNKVISGVFFNNLVLNGTGSTWTAISGTTVNAIFHATAGTLSTNNLVLLFGDVILNGGTLNANSSAILAAGNWTFSSGSFNAGTSTVTFGNQSANSKITSGNSSFANVIFGVSGYPSDNTTLNGPLVVGGNVTLATGTFNTNNYFVSVASGVFITSGTFSLGSSSMTVGGNWSMGNKSFSTFNQGTSTVTFTSEDAQTLSGSTTFYALRALTSAATLQFTAGTTQYITNMVDFENNYLRSTSSNATWYFALAGSSQTLKSLDVKDSNASLGNGMFADAASTNSGNNTNWYFGVTQIMADRYWILNSGSGNWSNTANWSTTQAGPGGASVPTSSQSAAFTGAENGNCNIDVAVNVSSMIIQGYSGTINTQNNSITIGNGYTQTSGTFTMGSSTASIGGSYTHSAGTFTSGTSTVTFNATTTQTITSGGAVFSHTIFNGAGGYWNLADQFSSTRNFTVNGGTVDTTSNNYGLYVGSNVVLSGGALTLNASTMTAGSNWTLQPGGTFNAGTSTVTFQGGSAGSYSLLTSSKTQSFAHLKFNQPNATWILQDGLNLGGNLTLAGGLDTNSSGNYSLGVTSDVVIINGGSLTMNASQVTIGGSFKFAAGGLDVGSSTVTLIGSGNKVISGVFFNNLVLNGTGSTWTAISGTTVNAIFHATAGTLSTNNLVLLFGDVILNGGTLNANSSAILAAGNWTFLSGSFNAGTSTVTFGNQSANSKITSGNSSFANVTFGVSGFPSDKTTLNDPLTVGGNITLATGTFNTGNYFVSVASDVVIASGTFTLGSSSMTVGGNWKNQSVGGVSFNQGSSTITLNGVSKQTLSGATTFYALRALTSGATLQFTNGATNYVTNMVDFENVGLLSAGASGTTWYFCYTGSSQTLTNLQVRDSNAIANGGYTMNATASTNLGNNTNWTFGTGITKTWTGATSTNWNTGSNWNPSGVPQTIDDVVIANVGNQPALLDQARTMNSLTVNSGATADLNNFNLTVSTYVTLTGTVTAHGTEQISVGGNWNASGGLFNYAQSTVTLTGANPTILSVGTSFYNLETSVLGSTKTQSDPLYVANNFTQDNQNSRFKTNNFTINVASSLFAGGDFQAGGSTITVGANWDLSIGSFTYGSSLEIMNGTGSIFYDKSRVFNTIGAYNLELSTAGHATAVVGVGSVGVNSFYVTHKLIIDGGIVSGNMNIYDSSLLTPLSSTNGSNYTSGILGFIPLNNSTYNIAGPAVYANLGGPQSTNGGQTINLASDITCSAFLANGFPDSLL